MLFGKEVHSLHLRLMWLKCEYRTLNISLTLYRYGLILKACSIWYYLQLLFFGSQPDSSRELSSISLVGFLVHIRLFILRHSVYLQWHKFLKKLMNC